MSSISGKNILDFIKNELDREVDQASIDIGCYEIDYRTKKNILIEESNNEFVADCEYFEYLANNPENNLSLMNSFSKNYPIEYKQTLDSSEINLPFELQANMNLISAIYGSTDDMSVLFAVFDYFTNELNFQKVQLLNKELSSAKAYENLLGDCTEMTKLMLSSLKYLGFDAQAVFVYEDVYGEKVDHVCTGVKMKNGETVLLDPMYENDGFDIKHKFIPLTMRQFWSFNENYFGIADLYSGRYLKAVDHFSTAMEIYDHDYSLYFNTGIALFHQKNFQNALLYFKKSEEIMPNRRAESSIEYLFKKNTNNIK